jgi:hypothetical protein
VSAPYTACPQCGAASEAEAETKCRAILDDCPMTAGEDWGETLAHINRMAAWEPTLEEIAALERPSGYTQP